MPDPALAPVRVGVSPAQAAPTAAPGPTPPPPGAAASPAIKWPGSRFGQLLAASVLMGLAFLAYLPLLPGSFVMDDLRLVQIDNPLVNGQLKPLSIWFQSDFPLSTFSFWVQWLAWGKTPLLYHLVCITLHAWSALLVWRLLGRLQIRGAWLAGALFALHPVCVNSVARIAELKNTLSLPFFLLSVLWYLRYEAARLYPAADAHSGARRAGTLAYTCSLLAFVLALLSKTSTVMLPLVLLACAAWQRQGLTRRDLVHTSPHFALALGFGLMSVWFQKYQALAGETLAPAGFAERLVVATRAVWFYLGKAVLPLHLNLVYPRWTVNPQAASAWLPLGLLGAGLLVCWHFRRSWGRHVLFALGCFGLTLFPGLGFFDAKFLTKWQVSDHLQYLPLIAPLALLAAALAELSAKVGRAGLSAPRRAEGVRNTWNRSNLRGALGTARPTVYGLAAAVVVLAAGGLTFQRARVFSSEENLMRDTLAGNPAATDAHNDLGVVLAQRKDFAGALAQFTAAVECNPKDPAAQSNLGQILGLLGRPQEGEAHLRAALALKPADAEARVRLARVLSAQNRHRAARGQLLVALRYQALPEARLQLAGLLYQAGEYRGAVAQFREVLRAQPNQPDVLNNLAWLLATCGDDQVRNGAEAVRHAEAACRLTGSRQSVYLSTLAAAYAEAGRFPEAVSTAEQALQQQTAAGESRLAAINQQLLEGCYRAGKPYHERPVRPQVQEASL